MISLNRPVAQTSSTKPRTCSHLNDSQPRPSETTQMKRVRQVSIVLREVAEIWRVTERPKKLKPLWSDSQFFTLCSVSGWTERRNERMCVM